MFNLVYKIEKAKLRHILKKKGFSNLYTAADLWIYCTPITLSAIAMSISGLEKSAGTLPFLPYFKDKCFWPLFITC